MLSSLRAVVEEVRRSGFGPTKVRALLAEVEFDLDEALAGGALAWRLDCRADGIDEPWASLCREGVRRIRIEPGVQRWEVRALVELLALDPPRGRDRRTELWLRELSHIRLDGERKAPAPEADPGRVLAARRTAARRLLDPGAPATVLPPLATDDPRLMAARGGLSWLDEAVPLPELPPQVEQAEGVCAGAEAVDWRGFVHLALAAESTGRPEGGEVEPPGVVLGCFDALLSVGDLDGLKGILSAVESSSWSEAAVLRAALLRPDRRRRLAELAIRGGP